MNFDSDNVTHRKPARSSSLSDISNVSNEKAIFDATMLSMPDSLHDDSESLTDLIEQNKTLSTQLLRAREEIENLNNENFRLKSDLQAVIKQLKIYNEIYAAPAEKCTTSSRSDKILQQKHIENPEYTTTMLNKETQTCSKIANIAREPSTTIPSTNNRDNNGIKTQCSETTQKNKLCMLSTDKTKGYLPTIEKVFSDNCQYCNYVLPNCSIIKLLQGIQQKLKGFTLRDYCILFISENDIREETDYINLINAIKNALKTITHTNIVICVPTYIMGAPIYNFKVEMFNNLLYMDLQNNKYAYIFDSNRDLSTEMFSTATGKINKIGMYNIYNRIMDNISIDISLYDRTDPSQSGLYNYKEDDFDGQEGEKDCRETTNFFRVQ